MFDSKGDNMQIVKEKNKKVNSFVEVNECNFSISISKTINNKDPFTNNISQLYNDVNYVEKNIDNVLKNINERNPVKLRNHTPKILVQNGVRDLPMYENPSHIRKNILTKVEAQKLGIQINKNDNYHGLGKEIYMKSVRSLDNPRAIFKNNKTGDYIILTTIKDSNNNTIIVPIEIETTTSHNLNIDINRIKSIYGYDRQNPNLNKYIKDNINSNKFTKIFGQKKNKSTGKIPQSSSLENNISRSDNNVNYFIEEELELYFIDKPIILNKYQKVVDF